ncbi:hypothetical protein COOONC_01064, partial [Cooperia oncophora]
LLTFPLVSVEVIYFLTGKCRHRGRRCESVGERDVGYINRKDIFYTGDITNVSEFQDDPDKFRSTGSKRRSPLSATSPQISHSLKESPGCDLSGTQDDPDNVEGSNMGQTISNMLFVPLLFDPIFLFLPFLICYLLSVLIRHYTFFHYMHREVSDLILLLHPMCYRLLARVSGLSNSIGRIAYGVVADRKLPLPKGLGYDIPRNRLWLYNISLSISGLLTTCCFIFTNFTSLAIYAALHGFFISAFICLASVILVDLLGLDKLTNAFGLLLLFQGLGTVAGPPIAGFLADRSDTYIWSFAFCGVNLMAAEWLLKNRCQSFLDLWAHVILSPYPAKTCSTNTSLKM